MRLLYLTLVAAFLPLGASAQDPNSFCSSGLARPTPGSIQLPMLPKFNLDVPQVCPPGTGVRAISFSHQKDQNLTFQESFGLQCVPSKSVVTSQCQWGSLNPNFPLSTLASAPADSVIAGVRFVHKKDENLTYQQSYAILSCKLQNPQPRNFPNGVPVSGTSKFFLQSNASCALQSPFYLGNCAIFGMMTALGFLHPKDLNLTYHESVTAICSFD
jgi:hypothetical protein